MASKTRSDGEGSIYYDASRDRYIASYVVDWRDGKPVRRKVSAKSKAAAATKLRKLREQVEHGHLPGGRVPTVKEWLTYWLADIAGTKNRPSTIQAYGTYVNRYLIPLLGDRRLDKLTPEHIAAAWAHLSEHGCPGKPGAKPLSPTSVHQAHVILSRALKVAVQRGIITRNPATLMDAPQVADTEIEVLSLDEAKRVVTVAKGKRNAARTTVAFSLGLRQGEALGLRWPDVDLDAGTLTVAHSLGRQKGKGLVLGPTKTKKTRTIALPAQLVDDLRAHRAEQNTERLAAGTWWHDDGYVFTRPDGRPLDPKDDWTSWRLLLAEAHVPMVRLHAARHTAATMLLALGVPEKVVMEILGHTKASITHRYQKRVDALHIDAAAKVGTAMWGD